MKRILSILLLSLFFIGNSFADDVTFVASAPKTVVVDNYFRLEYKVNTTTDVSEPILPDIKGFELLNGPTRSQSTSYSNINGKVTHSSTITYTYIFLAKEIGEFTIPGAKITANGKSITSNSVTINVLKENVTFVASAPKTVVVDNYFRLEYKVNTTTDVSEPILPDIKGFELLSGPARSLSKSYSNINGKVTHSYTITYTYIFLAKEIGEFTIPGAKITANGKSITSNSVTINVLKENGNGNGNMNNGSGSRSIGENDVFITATASKSKVFKDEALLVTYKLYTLYDVQGLNSLKVPQFDNFYSSEAYSPSNAQSDIEYYKGKEYCTVVLAKYLLQPQKSGKLKIEPMSMDVVLEKVVMNQDPFDFFGDFPERIRMNKHLKSNALEINVEALPNDAPASFSGAVGQYALRSELNNNELYTDNEATLKVILEGTGNLNFVDAPSVSLPVEFDTFPPVVTDEYKLSGDTYKGKKTFEYLFTPKSSGSYTIAPLQFTFFNTKTKKYETLTTDSIKVNVLRGAPKSASTSVAPSVDLNAVLTVK